MAAITNKFDGFCPSILVENMIYTKRFWLDQEEKKPELNTVTSRFDQSVARIPAAINSIEGLPDGV